ncbi:hypothetical protein BaRGS_00031296 [Batillaria attramentaria]|uniref:Uncharacterized protein n=1 Tax=Batillaria attramentaria TaxID=370345 RepID=A0ABD0JRB4_9CAEN
MKFVALSCMHTHSHTDSFRSDLPTNSATAAAANNSTRHHQDTTHTHTLFSWRLLAQRQQSVWQQPLALAAPLWDSVEPHPQGSLIDKKAHGCGWWCRTCDGTPGHTPHTAGPAPALRRFVQCVQESRVP